MCFEAAESTTGTNVNSNRHTPLHPPGALVPWPAGIRDRRGLKGGSRPRSFSSMTCAECGKPIKRGHESWVLVIRRGETVPVHVECKEPDEQPV